MARSVELAKDDKHFQQARDRLSFAIRSGSNQRKREIDDISFEDNQQWDPAMLIARSGQSQSGGPATPARPSLVINGVREPARQILNSMRTADLGIEITPADDFGDVSADNAAEIELREALVRRIQRESHASIGRIWAGKRAVIAGEGYYLVNTRYQDGLSMDQEVYIERIYNQNMVYLDPMHEQPTGRDCEYEFIGSWMEWNKFVSLYPEAAKHPQIQGAPDVFLDLVDSYPEWYQQQNEGDGKQRSIFIVSYWYRHYEQREAVQLIDGRVYWDGDAPDGATPEEAEDYLPSDVTEDQIKQRRTVNVPSIRYEKIAGGIVMVEETEWPCPFMPIVKVVGEEILPYDGERRAEGIVRPARDPAKAKNLMVSKLVEQIGLTPITTVRVDPAAIDGYESWYSTAATRALPYLPYRTYDDDGRQLNAPNYPSLDPNIAPVAQAIGMFDQAIQSTTGGSASERVGAGRSVQSARAIQQLQQEDAFNTSNFLDNLRVSVEYEGEIINALLYPIYGRPGRRLRGIDTEGEPRGFVMGPLPDGAQPPTRQKVGVLTPNARWNVAVKVAKNYDTRRQQASAVTGEMIDKNPALMTWFGDVFFKNSDMPGHQALAKRAKVMLDPRITAFLEAEEQGTQIDPATMAKMAQMQSQLQQAQAMMQQLAQEADANKAKIQTEIIKQQGEDKRRRDDFAQQVELQKMKDATSIRLAEIAAQVKGLEFGHTLLHESDALDRTQAHETALEAQSQAHERAMAVENKIHEASMAQAQAAPSAVQITESGQ